MRAGRFAVLMTLGAFALSACGSDSADTTTTTTLPATTTSVTAATTTTTSTTTLPTTTTSAHPPATATIVVVQENLALLGYFDGQVDGIAGDVTSAAIAKFQSDNDLVADGEFGPKTDGALTAALEGNTGFVESVQQILMDKKLYPGPKDGDYGKGTKRGVESLQKECEVDVTGRLDIATRLCIADLP